MQKPIFGYWSVRSLGESIRMMLYHLEVDFEDKQYLIGDDWIAKDKYQLGFEFPNLPYFIDDDIKLTESYAIFVYIALKYNSAYLGNTIIEQAYVNMIYGVLRDIFIPITVAAYDPDAIAKILEALDSKREVLDKVGRYLEGKRFFNGNQPTFVDFYAHELFERIEAFSQDYLANISPNFQAYKSHFRELAHMDDYLSMPRLKFNATKAYWGN
ncbi:unnamed protein product [Blepharisma stoltei]|uniref:glutathione transferase n=1 Tax=Blepharisma stoltei TaxID=1481888 RepID=A0AAU9JYG0_9CILI|nr:unnamed protein product [Blepharisma stoltei]